jgi:imidazole glycerol-phosphate synthase subunit HisH
MESLSMIAIIDYHVGNLASIKNMLGKIGEQVIISSKQEDLARAEKLILPGVGSFDTGMKNLSDLGLIETLNQLVLTDKKPILGICLGMQILGKSSEEGALAGLSWIDAETIKFKFENDPKRKIPNMGWNSLEVVRKDHELLDRIDSNSRFYFVHSCHVRCNNESDILARSNYGIDFVSVVGHENILGTQFHPEKSLKWGMQLLRNFSKMV